MASRAILITGALLGGFGVALGAFGAHGLRSVLDPIRLGWWNTAVQYQMWHAVALLALGVWPWPGRRMAEIVMAAGTIIFSGTLYLMALTGMRWLGAVTPIGGVLMIAGWAMIAWRAWRLPQA